MQKTIQEQLGQVLIDLYVYMWSEKQKITLTVNKNEIFIGDKNDKTAIRITYNDEDWVLAEVRTKKAQKTMNAILRSCDSIDTIIDRS